MHPIGDKVPAAKLHRLVMSLHHHCGHITIAIAASSSLHIIIVVAAASSCIASIIDIVNRGSFWLALSMLKSFWLALNLACRPTALAAAINEVGDWL